MPIPSEISTNSERGKGEVDVSDESSVLATLRGFNPAMQGWDTAARTRLQSVVTKSIVQEQ